MLRRSFLSLPAALAAQNFTDVKPSPQQVAWQDLEIGVLVHFGPNTFMDREWGEGNADPKVLQPSACEPGVKSSPWKGGKGDLVGDVVKAVRDSGLKFGVYLSPWDRHEPSYKDNKAYDLYYTRQLTELATRYGELTEFWLDGAGSEGHVYDFDRYVDTLRTYQPNTLIFADVGFLKYGDIRWVGNEAGFAPEDNWNVIDRRGYLRYRPAEADTPLRERNWFWHPNAEKNLKPLDKLLDIYLKTVGRGAQLVLGLAPDNRGLIPENHAARLKEFGDAIGRLYGKPAPGDASPQGEIFFRSPATFNRTVAMEWLYDGQHIHRHAIEVKDTASGPWREVHRGTTVGHKKIDMLKPVRALAVRLRILESTGNPRIRSFQVFNS
jgi:alpha-L-fucosidase